MNTSTTVEFDTTAKGKEIEEAPVGAAKFTARIIEAKRKKRDELDDILDGFDAAFMAGAFVHMAYMADRGRLIDAVMDGLKDLGYNPEQYTCKGRKIICVDLLR